MTQEEKAKAYDEAIERAKEMIKAMTNVGGVAKVDNIQYLFPELKESEDESIRKELISHFHDLYHDNITKLPSMNTIESWIAWLKSLRPQSQWKPSEEQMKILDDVLNFAANHESPDWNYYIFGTLNNLIRQLKKLMEE